MGTRRIGVLF